MTSLRALLLAAGIAAVALACSSDSGPGDASDASADGVNVVDTGPPDVQPASTAHCHYEPPLATAHAGGTVTAGDIRAGAAEADLDLPVGSALGAFTARAMFEGSNGVIDGRQVEYSGSFNPSVGIETAPRLRALAITAGEETVVILKADLGAADDDVTYQVARALGPEYQGKVLFATSHSHSAFGHYLANTALGVGFGRLRTLSHRRLIDQLVAVARRALDARVPARIGFAHDGAFDPTDMVSHDRRSENDDLPNGRDRKDHDLYVLRVDGADGAPIAALAVFGVHGTVLDADNNLNSTDAPGAIERAVEETFDRPVVVMHLQGAAGDVSPSGTGGIDCGGRRPCYNFARAETVGRYAAPAIRAAWESAGGAMRAQLPLEMLTRQVPLGPDWRTFNVRNNALAYAPFERRRTADRRIFADNDGGAIVSPIDEFNAPVGAALCGEQHGPLLISGTMPGTDRLAPYWSCIRVDAAETLLGPLLDLPFDPGGVAVCASTRTTVSAIRMGDYMFAVLPGEPLNLLADHARALSPYDPAHTIVVGYAQGHVGYLLTADDWLRAGYEPTINFWGPLEGEYIVERAAELMRMAQTDMREEAGMSGADHGSVSTAPDNLPLADPAPRAGTVPSPLPSGVYLRGAPVLTSAQPVATVPRLESARFVWIGEDPVSGTPRVTLQRESPAGSGTYVPVTRRSGRAVRDGDLLLTWTPDPLRRDAAPTRTHYWAVEWQAVTPWGTASLDEPDDRPGVPLGRYRFHVDGTGYAVDSSAFEVSAGALAVTATRGAGTILLNVGYLAAGGWRLLDANATSNALVGVRRGPLSAVLTLDDGSTQTLGALAPGMPGQVVLNTGADTARVRMVRVTDRFGNTGTVAP